MSVIAPILEQTVSKIRFCVDDVRHNQERLPVHKAKSQLEQCFKQGLLAFSHDDTFQVIQDKGIHPLPLAVHAAFSDHRPLRLTPDIIWIAIAQGFAQHINNHAEALRSRFVRHQGKQQLVVECKGIPNQSQHWVEAVHQWTLHIRDHVGAGLYQLLECNFSTTTPITQTASHVVMMDVFQQYFDYEILCVCGIPEITLLGTVEDWQSIYERVQRMAQYDLSWWTERLLPICREFVETASGRPSLEFWRCIYKPEAVYGAKLITGWLADLFPYIKHPVSQAPSVRNPVLKVDRCELPPISDSDPDEWFPVGISAERIPSGLSQVAFKLQTLDSQEYALELVAGFVGVCQDSDLGTLQPEIGWAVRERDYRFAELLDKIQQQHLTQPPINWSTFDSGFLDVPKEHIQLLDRFDGATLYANSGHSWQIAKYDSGKVYEFPQLNLWRSATHLIDLEDGRCIAYLHNFRSGEWLIILGKPAPYADPDYVTQRQLFKLEDAVIIAKGIPQLLERIFQTEGCYYFDEPSFLPDDGLNNLELG